MKKSRLVFYSTDIQGNPAVSCGGQVVHRDLTDVLHLRAVFVSLNFTTHLTDVPMVKCYINDYKKPEP